MSLVMFASALQSITCNGLGTLSWSVWLSAAQQALAELSLAVTEAEKQANRRWILKPWLTIQLVP